MVFGLTNRPKIDQNHDKSRSKNRLVSGIDFGPLFLTFWTSLASLWPPFASQNRPWDVPWPPWDPQVASQESTRTKPEAHWSPKRPPGCSFGLPRGHFGPTSSSQSSKFDPKTTPRAKKLLQNDTRTQFWHVILNTLHVTLPYLTLCTFAISQRYQILQKKTRQHNSNIIP